MCVVTIPSCAVSRFCLLVSIPEVARPLGLSSRRVKTFWGLTLSVSSWPSSPRPHCLAIPPSCWERFGGGKLRTEWPCSCFNYACLNAWRVCTCVLCQWWTMYLVVPTYGGTGSGRQVFGAKCWPSSSSCPLRCACSFISAWPWTAISP